MCIDTLRYYLFKLFKKKSSAVLLLLVFPLLASAASKVIESHEPGNGASTRPVFVELYTSQGCYSCPPAERWMNSLVASDQLWTQLIPINFHVDYWDYLGWKDPFSRKVFSSRQRQYQHFGHTRTIATPGFVVNGEGWNGWFSRNPLPKPTNAFAGKLIVALHESGSLNVEYKEHGALQALKRPNIHAALLGFGIETKVPRGENAGKTLSHDFVVVGYQRASLAQIESVWRTTIELPTALSVAMTRQALVLWVTEQDDPKPVQVAADWL